MVLPPQRKHLSLQLSEDLPGGVGGGWSAASRGSSTEGGGGGSTSVGGGTTESWEFRSALEAPIARLESLDEIEQHSQVRDVQNLKTYFFLCVTPSLQTLSLELPPRKKINLDLRSLGDFLTTLDLILQPIDNHDKYILYI